MGDQAEYGADEGWDEVVGDSNVRLLAAALGFYPGGEGLAEAATAGASRHVGDGTDAIGGGDDDGIDPLVAEAKTTIAGLQPPPWDALRESLLGSDLRRLKVKAKIKGVNVLSGGVRLGQGRYELRRNFV